MSYLSWTSFEVGGISGWREKSAIVGSFKIDFRLILNNIVVLVLFRLNVVCCKVTFNILPRTQLIEPFRINMWRNFISSARIAAGIIHLIWAHHGTVDVGQHINSTETTPWKTRHYIRPVLTALPTQLSSFETTPLSYSAICWAAQVPAIAFEK